MDVVRDKLNERLAEEGKKDRISKSTLERFFSTLPRAVVVQAHKPEVAESVARHAIDFAGQLSQVNEKVVQWLDEAEHANKWGVDSNGNAVELGPDFQSRVMVARELRGQLTLYADMLEKVFNAEQIKLFQEAVLEAIAEADPEVARKVRDKLRERTEMRRAALFGA